ncbi:MAG: UPF0175 family protein [Thaumarchaeota archaeon]|nr:UPF0175 family protein [Nitrososphaerota archaeon]
MSERISLVIPRRLRKAIRELQELTGEDQSTLLRRLLDKGLAEVKMEIAVDNYVKGKTSLEKSSETAGVSLWSFLDELRKRNISLKYSIADAENEIQKIIGKKKEGRQARKI